MPFGTLNEKDFFGRGEELSDLYRRALQTEQGIAQSVFLSGLRGMGKTELLKQLFSHLFWKQDKVVPFYYSLNNALLSAEDFARDYVTRYICQRLAFEKKEQALLSLDGLSIEGLSSLVEESRAAWAREILDRYVQNSGKPVDSLRVALGAPHQSTLTSGKPVAVLIDEFQRLKQLHVGGAIDPQLVSLFEDPFSFKGTLYVITGNEAEIEEMPVSGGLARVTVSPLGFEDATQQVLSLLRAYGVTMNAVPEPVVRHLGGNPFYLRCLATAAAQKKNHEERDLWLAYFQEITGGNIYLSWSSVLKNFFPDMGMRRSVLEITYKMYHTRESLSQEKIAEAFSAGGVSAEPIIRALHHTGFIQGEFGVFRASEDKVVTDFINCLYMRVLLGIAPRDIEEGFLEQQAGEAAQGTVAFEMTLPMIREAELVAARCLEQIGKNLRIQEEAIGQLQIAVIEACINALEHSKGGEKKIYLRFDVTEDRLEASIESSGREFVVQETGEPFVGKKLAEDFGRGWGVKLMKRFTDSVRFEKTSRGTKVVLVKNMPKTAGAYKEGGGNGE
jgi:serine/threonine-protein kinase RsbW